jgi:hypothetical protein
MQQAIASEENIAPPSDMAALDKRVAALEKTIAEEKTLATTQNNVSSDPAGEKTGNAPEKKEALSKASSSRLSEPSQAVVSLALGALLAKFSFVAGIKITGLVKHEKIWQGVKAYYENQGKEMKPMVEATFMDQVEFFKVMSQETWKFAKVPAIVATVIGGGLGGLIGWNRGNRIEKPEYLLTKPFDSIGRLVGPEPDAETKRIWAENRLKGESDSHKKGWMGKFKKDDDSDKKWAEKQSVHPGENTQTLTSRS